LSRRIAATAGKSGDDLLGFPVKLTIDLILRSLTVHHADPIRDPDRPGRGFDNHLGESGCRVVRLPVPAY
jgi:hypothetical protein